MIDWTKSMQQTFEFYVVNPDTWKDAQRLTTVKSCTIERDSEVETLGSATIDITDSVGECYIRVYLIASQNGITEKHPLGTYIVQTPSSNFDGKTRSVSMDAYTPLLELKEKQPPIGYYVPKSTVYYKVEESDARFRVTDEEVTILEGSSVLQGGMSTWGSVYSGVRIKNGVEVGTVYYVEHASIKYKAERIATYTVTTEKVDIIQTTPVAGAKTVTGERVFRGTTPTGSQMYCCAIGNLMDIAYQSVRDNLRAPVTKPESNVPLTFDFVADTSDTWLSFIRDLIANANYKLDLDELGRVLFAPNQDTASLQPVWTYTDDNSSILYPDLSMDHDLYGIPNEVEVVYSTNSINLVAIATNDDPNSQTSTVNRGRKITHRVTDPNVVGVPTQEQLNEYAEQLLRDLSTIEYTITYSHGYCPVRIGDCVRLNYSRTGLGDIKAKVISQSIKCEAGCKVTEKAVFTTKLWG